MKLYATVASERAQKGQGGNEYLDIEILGEHQQPIARLLVSPQPAPFLPSIELIYTKSEVSKPMIQALDRAKYHPKGEKEKSEYHCEEHAWHCSGMGAYPCPHH